MLINFLLLFISVVSVSCNLNQKTDELTSQSFKYVWVDYIGGTPDWRHGKIKDSICRGYGINYKLIASVCDIDLHDQYLAKFYIKSKYRIL